MAVAGTDSVSAGPPSTASSNISVTLIGELGALDPPLPAPPAIPTLPAPDRGAPSDGDSEFATSLRSGCFKFVSDFDRQR